MQSTSSWDGTPYKAYPTGQPQLSVVKVTLAPHTTMKWHTHAVPNAGYVLSGEVTVESKDGAKKHFTAGQVIPETVDIVHRGVSGDQPTVLIVFYAGTPGVPLSQPAGDAK
jgi:quercetin dioxygenase-like cupin family protein